MKHNPTVDRMRRVWCSALGALCLFAAAEGGQLRAAVLPGPGADPGIVVTRPDLVVSEVVEVFIPGTPGWFTGRADSYVVRISVTNQGRRDSTPCTLVVNLRESMTGIGGGIYYHGDDRQFPVRALAPGETVTFGIATEPYRTYAARTWVDTYNQVVEMREDNNIAYWFGYWWP